MTRSPALVPAEAVLRVGLRNSISASDAGARASTPSAPGDRLLVDIDDPPEDALGGPEAALAGRGRADRQALEDRRVAAGLGGQD